jgi:thiamine biosynthesis protein ThiS
MSDMIDIQVNGESRTVATDLTIEDLLRSFDLHPRMIVVEHNGDILRRERYQEVRVSSGDQLELVHFVGGG